MSFEKGLAGFGRGYAYFSAIIVTVLSVILIIIALVTYSDPDVPPNHPGDNKKVAMIMIATSLLILTVSWGWVWLTDTSPLAAEAGGVIGGIDIARSIFGR
jgi:hypothetical protein